MWDVFSIEALNKQLFSARLWRSWGLAPQPPWCFTLAVTGKPAPMSGCLVSPLSAVSTMSSLRVKWKVMESVCVNLAFSHSACSCLSSSSALILIIPVKPQTAPCTLLRFSAAAAYRLCHSHWQGRQEAQHSFILHKGRPVQLDKYYFLLLTAPPVKLVLYYFSHFLLSYCSFPLIITLPLHQCLRKGLTRREKEDFKSRD